MANPSNQGLQPEFTCSPPPSSSAALVATDGALFPAGRDVSCVGGISFSAAVGAAVGCAAFCVPGADLLGFAGGLEGLGALVTDGEDLAGAASIFGAAGFSAFFVASAGVVDVLGASLLAPLGAAVLTSCEELGVALKNPATITIAE